MKKSDIFYKSRIFELAKTGVILSLLFILSSCFSVKPGTTKSAANLYESFFVGEEGTQYFIKPLKFTAASGEYLEPDITFRYKKEIKDSATVNISFLTNSQLKSIDSLKIYNGENSALIKDLNLLFTERSKEMYKTRFSMKVKLADLTLLFAKNDWDLILYKNGDSTLYGPSKATKKKIDKLNYEIFSLF